MSTHTRSPSLFLSFHYFVHSTCAAKKDEASQLDKQENEYRNSISKVGLIHNFNDHRPEKEQSRAYSERMGFYEM